MTVDCMTCAAIEQKICDLADELGALTRCGGVRITEDGTTFDYSPALEAKKEALRAWREMFRMKCEGSGDLYEFIHVPCVKPATCVGTSCNVPSKMRQNRRRYAGGRRR